MSQTAQLVPKTGIEPEKLSRRARLRRFVLKKDRNRTIMKMLVDLIPEASTIVKLTVSETRDALNVEQTVKSMHQFSDVVDKTSTGLAHLNFGLAVFGFFGIPLLWLIGFLLGDKPKIDMPSLLKWLYSGLAVVFLIIALLIPAVAAPLALIGASISFAIAIANLVYVAYTRYTIWSELRAVNKKLKEVEQELKDLAPDSTKAIELVKQKQNLEAEKKELEEQKKDASVMKIVDKTVAVALGALVLLGLVIAIYFPAAGLGIILASTGIALVYTVARITIPKIYSLGHFLASLTKKITQRLFGGKEEAPEEKLENELVEGIGAEDSDTASVSYTLPPVDSIPESEEYRYPETDSESRELESVSSEASFESEFNAIKIKTDAASENPARFFSPHVHQSEEDEQPKDTPVKPRVE